MASVCLDQSIQGSILDIGGGGEGVIGRIYQAQVTAIDNRAEELEEAPDGFTKRVMDATSLEFDACSFDNATAFYTFMYMEREDHPKALCEIWRVLKPGGSLFIWDAVIEHAQPFVVELDIDANGTSIHTGYGIVKEDGAQDAQYFVELCQKLGFRLIRTQLAQDQFFLCFRK